MQCKCIDRVRYCLEGVLQHKLYSTTDLYLDILKTFQLQIRLHKALNPNLIPLL